MQQRGRKSGAKLSIVAGAIDGRPRAPENLSKREVEIWEKVVSSESVDFFRTGATQLLLADYCRHAATAERFGQFVAIAIDDTECSAKDLAQFLKLRDKETRAAAGLATKLRMTNQSRYQPSVASTASKSASTERKPWQMMG